MTKIHIPFKRRFRESMTRGKKTMTTRTSWYGSPGDEFRIFDTTFRITDIFQLKLKDVARLYWAEEGCSSEDDFIRVWCNIHPRMKFDKERLVCCHVFEKVDRKVPA